MKEMKRYLKTMPVLAVALLLLAGIGFAALLTHYGQVTGEVTVDRAINLYENGIPMSNAEAFYSLAGIGGSSYTNELYTATNDAQVPITMDVAISYSPRQTGNIPPEWTSQCDGITATAYENLTKTLVLDNKNPDWSLTPDDDTGATLTYDVIGDEFVYSLSATGLVQNTNYSIIYYADKENRMVNWGGNNPGALIGTFITGSAGGTGAGVSGSVDLDMNLPTSPDANINGDDYCAAPDYYNTCYGAKIWIVPTNAIESYPNPDADVSGWVKAFWNSEVQPFILFETDLIHYYDTDSGDLTGFGLDSNKILFGTSSTELTIPAGDSVDFIILNEFAPNAISDGCEITVSLDVPTAP